MKEGVQGLQALAFCVVTVNYELQNLSSKESLGVKFKDGICTELCLNSGLKATSIFKILLCQDGFENYCPETKFQTSLPKVSLKK